MCLALTWMTSASAIAAVSATAAGAEVVPLQEPLGGKQLEGAVDGGQRDTRIERIGAPIDLLDIGVVLGPREDAGNDASLPRHPQPILGAQILDAAKAGVW